MSAYPIRAIPSLPHGHFFNGLFDFSFNTLVATRVIKFVYGLYFVVLALGVTWFVYQALDVMLFGRYTNFTSGILMLLVVPPAAFVYLVFARVSLEVLMTFFRISDSLAEMNRKMR